MCFVTNCIDIFVSAISQFLLTYFNHLVTGVRVRKINVSSAIVDIVMAAAATAETEAVETEEKYKVDRRFSMGTWQSEPKYNIGTNPIVLLAFDASDQAEYAFQCTSK